MRRNLCRPLLEHLHLELTLNQVPHEIVVVDDGSQDRTWEVLQQLRAKIPGLRPVKTTGNTALAARWCPACAICRGTPW